MAGLGESRNLALSGSTAAKRGLSSPCRPTGVTVPVMAVTIVAAFNMGAACSITRDLVVRNPVKPDWSPDYEAVQGWPLVTALYNGIEQALKMLLLVPSDTEFTLEKLARRRYGHDLEMIYAQLGDADRCHIEQHFREHRSLHDYLDIPSAEQFIGHINNGGRHGGLVSWRYILIEDISQIPSTSLWTMSEIWDAICCLIRENVFEKQDDCFRLSRRLNSKFNRLITYRAIPYDGYLVDLDRWRAHIGHSPLAAWIDLLTKAHYELMDEVQAPDRLRPALADMARTALAQMASDSADPDHDRLLHRIHEQPSLAWDPSDNSFR